MSEFKEEHIISAFKRCVKELKADHMYVDSSLEIDKRGNVIISIRADNEPR